MRIERIGDATLYLADCIDVLPTLDKVDAVITDPPYGIKADKGKNLNMSFNGSKPIKSAFYPENKWDLTRPSNDLIKSIVSKGKVCILWGGNYFADLLTPQGKWLWWDKCQTMPTFGDGELAWTNLPQSTPKKFVLANNKIIADRTIRHHPTQKPLPLMMWCINQCTNNPQTILDPFMGSGTTGVAAIQMGRKFIGIEREESYFNIACERIEQATKQSSLFDVAEMPKQEQQELL
jgi:site-specific DNA-methyltransferase (adenine-specific)/modification methylase